MEMARLVWTATDEGEVTFTNNFRASSGVLKLDALKDWIAVLERQYEIEHAVVYGSLETKQ